MTVERYDFFRDHMADCHCEIDTRANGNYVRSDDYDALAKENDILNDGLIKAGEHTLSLRARLAAEQRVTAVIEDRLRQVQARLAEAVALLKSVDACMDAPGICRKCQDKINAFLRPADSAPADWQCTCGQFMSDHFDRCSNCKGMRTWTQVATASAPAVRCSANDDGHQCIKPAGHGGSHVV